MNCIRCDIPEDNLSANGYCEHCFDLQDEVQELIESARNAWSAYRANPDSYDNQNRYGLAIGKLMNDTGWGIAKTTRIINEMIAA